MRLRAMLVSLPAAKESVTKGASAEGAAGVCLCLRLRLRSLKGMVKSAIGAAFSRAR